MTIYAVDDSILYEAPVTKDALIKCVLMGDHYVELPFSTGQYLSFPRGSYIIHDNTKFVALDTVLPEPKEGGGYQYSVKFWGIENLMKNRKVFWLKGSNKESHFHNTTSLDQFGQLIVDNMNDFVGDSWTLGSVPEDKMLVTKLITFNGVSCWDALADIAEQFGVEWWVQLDYDRVSLSFGKREYGDRVDVKVGEVITSIPSSKGTDSNFGTRFYVYGSTKNLPADYNDTAQGGVVNHVSESRLRMDGEEYIDVKLNMTPAEIIEQVVIFEEIFPKNTDTVTDVSTIDRKIEGAAEDSDQQTFTAYQVTAANTPFVPSDVIAGEDFKIRFTSGMLSGWEFGVDLRDDNDNRIDPSSWNESSNFNKKFEIVAITEQAGDRVITTPNESMYPVEGDTFILIGVTLPDERVKEAEIELRVRGEEWAREHSADTDVYNCPTNPVYCAKEGVNFDLGQNVKLIDPRFEGGYRNSRIQGYEKSLWNESIATYTIGDNTPYTRIGSIESTVREISTTSKTIGVILDSLSKTAANLQEMFAFEEDSMGKRIRANFALYSLGFISAKGKNPSAGGGTGGSTTLGGLNDVLLTSLASDHMLVYNGTHWVNTPMSSIKPDLSAYATKAALQSVDLRLSNVETIFEADSDGAINKWSEVVAFLDGIEGDTLDSILSQFATMQWVENKGYITAAALDPYALATAIPTNNNQLANGAGYITSAALSGYATQSWVEAKKYLTAVTSAMVISALGYTPYNAANFTQVNIKSTLGISDWALASSKPSYSYSDISGTPTKLSQFTDDVVVGYYLPIGGTAKNAEQLGGQLPTYYATASALATLSDTVTAFKTLFDSFFEQDETNNAIKAKLSLYSVGGISAKGSSGVSSGSGSGVSYNRLDSWDAYTTSMAGYVLSAALGYDLHTRLGVVERAGYATESWVLGKGYATTSDLDSRINALVNGAPAAYDTLKEIADVLAGNVNSIGDIITTLGTKADKATTLAGYGIADAYTTTQVDSKLAWYLPLSGGTIMGPLTLPANGFSIIGNEGNGSYNKIVNVVYDNGLWGTKDATEGPSWSIRNALTFNWYSDRWIVGAVRADDATSAGFGVGLIDAKDDGTIYQKNLFRIDAEGEIFQNGVALSNKYLGIDSTAKFATGIPTVQYNVGLGSATYGVYGGFVQSSFDGPTEGEWFSRIKVLHNNTVGYYQEIAMPFFQNDLYYRRMSEGVLKDWVRIPSENSVKGIVRGIDTAMIPFIDGIVPLGWHRIAVTTRSFNHANNIRVRVTRSWFYNQSEAFTVDISMCYGKVVFSQVSGCAAERIIDKIRVVGYGDNVAYIDVHVKYDNANYPTITVRGTATSLMTTEYLGDVDTDNQYVFSITDGASFSESVMAPIFQSANYLSFGFKNEEFSPETVSSANQYLPSGTSLLIAPIDINPASSNLVVLSCRNGSRGTNNAYFGAINSGGSNNAAYFVIGRRTGVESWAESLRVDEEGNLGIGTTNPAEKLDVAGNAKISGSIRIGDAVLSWDATTNSLTLTHADGSTLCGIAASGHITAKA